MEEQFVMLNNKYTRIPYVYFIVYEYNTTGIIFIKLFFENCVIELYNCVLGRCVHVPILFLIQKVNSCLFPKTDNLSDKLIIM